MKTKTALLAEARARRLKEKVQAVMIAEVMGWICLLAWLAG